VWIVQYGHLRLLDIIFASTVLRPCYHSERETDGQEVLHLGTEGTENGRNQAQDHTEDLPRYSVDGVGELKVGNFHVWCGTVHLLQCVKRTKRYVVKLSCEDIRVYVDFMRQALKRALSLPTTCSHWPDPGRKSGECTQCPKLSSTSLYDALTISMWRCT
jgi:hypothetical protein